MTTPIVQHNATKAFFTSFQAKRKCKNAFVLDSGCGDGYASRAFITHGASRVFAYDPGLAYNPKYDHPDIIWMRDIPRGNFFDIVWSHHVIEHIENPVEYLRELRILMRHEGELWLTCPNTANCAVYAAGHLHNFTITNILLCLQAAGYPVNDLRWYLTKGQLRVRVKAYGIPGILPDPFEKALSKDIHFSVNKLPQIWRWQNEE